MDEQGVDVAVDIRQVGHEPGDSVTEELSAGRQSRGAALSRKAFFDRVVVRVRGSVSSELRSFQARAHGHLLKVHFDNERVHFEVWPNSHRGTIEIGLHFEDGPTSTAAYLQFFDARIVELKHRLGAEVELERWTASWGHFFYLLPLEPLDAAKANRTAGLLASLIGVLQPLVQEASVPRERVDEPTERRRFRRRAGS
ncbi:MAG: hypothetical protein QOF33_3125 [Thermomicrobiales bacterium]|jgi:hypothetical protein|nr:hypothetical protein [Thermomicrobiales bacterium]